MSENILTVVRIALIVSLFLMRFGHGLEIAPRDLRFLRARRGLMLRSVLVVLVLAPLASLAILLVLRPETPTAVALAILAACPAAPMAIGQVTRAHGTLPYAASVQLAVATLAVVTTPLTLVVLGAALDFHAQVRPLAVARSAALAQFVPIGLGVLTRAKLPRVAGIGRRLSAAAGVLLAIIVVAIVAVLREGFVAIGPREYAAIALTALATLALGHFFAPRDVGMQHALALETAMRNPGLALLVAAASFPDARPLPILLPCVVVTVFAAALYGGLHGRRPVEA